MTTLQTFKFGPPFKGVARQEDPYVAAVQGYFSKAHNVNYDYTGAITPMPKMMKEVAQLGTPAYFMFYHYGVGWISDAITLTSGIYNWGITAARTKANYTVSYVTTTQSNGTYGTPKKYRGTESFDMGIVAPTAAPSVSAGTGGNVTVCHTWLAQSATEDDVVSNPSPFYPTPGSGVTVKGGGTVTVTWPASSRVTHAQIWATQEGSPSGTLYYAGYITRVVGQTTGSMTLSSARTTSSPMNWGPGGNPESTDDIYFDHSPPGGVTCFSNRLHGSEAGASDNDGGTLFYAMDNVVGWTETGQHEYFPAANMYKLTGTVQAMVTSGTQTYAFLPDQVWAFTGQHSTAISARQLGTRRGVQVGKAKTVQATPYGIIYVSQEGLTLFNGEDARLICREALREFNDSDHWVGAYVDGYYYLCKPQSGGVDTWKIDLQNPENPVITTTDINFWATHAVEQGSWLSPTGGAIISQGNNWSSTTTYAKDQSFGSGVRKYVSLQNSNLNKEPELRQSWWALIPNGQTFLLSRGFDIVTSNPPVWSSTATYSANDVVSYNGVNYFTSASITGVAPATTWTQWVAPTGSTTYSYNVGDSVYYNGVWTCILAHTSTAASPKTPAVGSTYWSAMTWSTHNNSAGYNQGVCPYTEDPNTNTGARLQVDVISNPIRPNSIGGLVGLRKFRADGNMGEATLTFMCDVPDGWTSTAGIPSSYSVSISLSNLNPRRYMLPKSLRGKSFQFRIQSSQDYTFNFRQLEIEGSVNR